MRPDEQVVSGLAARDAQFTRPDGAVIRRLTVSDGEHLSGLSPESAWVMKTWGGAAGLAASGYGWGAFADGRCVSVACSFFVGCSYEDLGAVTEAGYEGRGLSTACSGGLCGDVRGRGRRASWTTSLDNVASLRVAQKLGFTRQRSDWLYVVGVEVPKP